MGLVWVVSDYDIGRFEIPMNVALRMNTLQPIHELKRDDDYGLYLKLALFEWFFKLF